MSDQLQMRHADQAHAIVVKGQPYSDIPKDLYIPPSALRVFLESFTGPLDLLLYLIKKQNFEIESIPIATITRQYMHYIEMMEQHQLNLAADYLVMAAMLAEIKSRALLPRPPVDDEQEEDPRAALIKRLQAYEQIKAAAERLDQLPRRDRDFLSVAVNQEPAAKQAVSHPDVCMNQLLEALARVLKKSKLNKEHIVKSEALSIRVRMSRILDCLEEGQLINFSDFFTSDEGRVGVVVSFIAVLELIKQSVIELVQDEPFAEIFVKTRIKDSERQEETV